MAEGPALKHQKSSVSLVITHENQNRDSSDIAIAVIALFSGIFAAACGRMDRAHRPEDH